MLRRGVRAPKRRFGDRRSPSIEVNSLRCFRAEATGNEAFVRLGCNCGPNGGEDDSSRGASFFAGFFLRATRGLHSRRLGGPGGNVTNVARHHFAVQPETYVSPRDDPILIPRRSFPSPVSRGFQHRPNQHSPKLVHRWDDRWEIRCPQCEGMVGDAMPIGIGLPVTNRAEAESMARNHARRPGQRRRRPNSGVAWPE